MTTAHRLSGVYAAAITPLKPDFSPDPNSLPKLLDFLAQRGCHGVLLFGTTGEGPSIAPKERLLMLRAALEYRQTHPTFRLLFGTGTPSFEETVELTKTAFDLGVDGVVVIPPYYFRKISDEGLLIWYSQLIQRAVPSGGAFLGYHIPPVTGIDLSFDLLRRLRDAFPDRFAGIKDSSADLEHARNLGKHFGNELVVLNGTDRLFSHALQAGASGCITALANLFSPALRWVWDSHLRGEEDEQAQARLNSARALSESYPPAPPLLKMLLAHWYNFPLWPVCPPLLPMPPSTAEKARVDFEPLRYD